MIDKRRWPRTHRRAGSIHKPAPSGPRWLTASRIRVTYASLTSKAPVANVNAPLMPHISGALPRFHDQIPADDRLGEASRPFQPGRQLVGDQLALDDLDP